MQCAVPPRYHFITRALYYNARYHLGTARALYYNARYRLGTARALHYNARYRLGTARALYYNARYRHPVCVLQSFNWIGMSEELPRKHQQKATKRNLNIVVPALLQTGRSPPLQLVLRQRHPASRDQLTDQEQCEAAKRITTRAKILSIDGPKPSAKNTVDSRVAKVGLPSSRTCVGINVRRAWRTIARGAANHGNPAVCKTSVAYLRKQSQLALFFARRQKISPTKRPPFWGPETDPKTGAKSSGHKQIKLRLNEWPPFWGPFLDSKTGAVWSAKFWSPGEK